ELAVVDGAGDVVGDRGGGGVQPDHRVDDELLALGALVFQHAVPGEHAQAEQADPVQAHGSSAAAASCHAAATTTASRLAGTSWTRVHHAPAAAARAVTAPVAS